MSFENFEVEYIYPYMIEKVNKLKEFISQSKLNYESTPDFSIAYKFNNKIIASGSIEKYVLKYISVDKEWEGSGLAAKVVTELINFGNNNGYTHLFVYTKPTNIEIFTDLGFYKIASTDEAVLMENKFNGIKKFVDSLEKGNESGIIGCIVANCNPFTLGHKFLMEYASKNCDLLHVFILSEDKSDFPADVRYKLVKEGTKGLKNILIHPTSKYMVSSATFPTYFLKDDLDTEVVTAKLDLELFCNWFVPALKINVRFAGEEPMSQTTNIYNEQMAEILPRYGVQFEVIKRIETIQSEIISASNVRKLLKENDFEKLKNFVPETTFNFFKTAKGIEIINKIKEK